MVAVDACSQTRGGRLAPAIASPTTRVDRRRDSRISRRFCGVYRQLTLRPARLMTTSAPSSSAVQSPSVSASHAAVRHGAEVGLRLRTTTPCPPARKCRARIVPTCPEPPGMTIFKARLTVDGAGGTNKNRERRPDLTFRDDHKN